MVDPSAYPVLEEENKYTKTLKNALERVKQRRAGNTAAPQPVQPPAPGSVPEPATPTEELNQSYMNEELDPLRVENLFRPDYNKSLQELIKRKLGIKVRIEEPDIQTEYRSNFSMNETSPIGVPKYDTQQIVKLKAIYPWEAHEEIELNMKFRKDLIFTNELSAHFPQLNDFNTNLSVGARVALRLALILGKIGKELQRFDGDFEVAANSLGIVINSYTTHMRWIDSE